ncbi:Metallo-hydrolase/oxidoreductase [Lentinus tigrinus ALCF2SS1-6]|uniref:Metallo-hydrolase/oxidoreductase n=1 Tax=Lentinus tigrinus ALCF2SS1-6 TaxID=1328759 RepID=A0A5C2SKB2_9APHY|nr:Metallo-hydrolase/oxidoreductase [Lentinus tigrinus ALCF2SS1-6]
MSLPPPAKDQAYCDVSALDAGNINMLLGQLVDVAVGDEMTDLPVLSFLLRHSRTGDILLFDLGIRPDVENYSAGALELTRKMGMTLQGRDIPAALERGGVSRADVKRVVLSHIHFDHTGYPRAFPNATFILANGALKIIEEKGPVYDNSFYAVDVPLERTVFVNPELEVPASPAMKEEWAPLGPFPRALDLYGDGSLYLVDAPGHIPGHLNALARTSADGGWVYLGADSAHDWRLLTGEAGIGCHHVWGCVHEDRGKAEETIERMKVLAGTPRVRVLLGHDKPFVKEGKGYWPDRIESL